MFKDFFKSCSRKVRRTLKTGGKLYSKLFMWVYSAVFVFLCVMLLVGIIQSSYAKGTIDFGLIVQTVEKFYNLQTAGVVVTIVIFLVDRDGDGVLDKAEKDLEEDKPNKSGSSIPPVTPVSPEKPAPSLNRKDMANTAINLGKSVMGNIKK